MRPLRVFIYVQHLLGIGHLVRANRIAAALHEDGFEVTVAMGGAPVPGVPGPGIRLIELPAVKAGEGFAVLKDTGGQPIGEAFKEARKMRLIAALADCQPDAVVIETFPFGRRAMRFELLPLLEAAGAMARKPLIACSVRDILQERGKEGRAEETAAAVETYFDMVLVHGDPNFALFDETFPVPDRMAGRIVYTGLVAGPPPPPPTDIFDIVISAGGGAAGLELLRAAVQLGGELRCCLITGPNLPRDVAHALRSAAPAGIEIYEFRADFPSLLWGTQLSVSQAGYNTVCDILRAGCRSLLIPYAKGGETEQTARALRLAKLGLADVLSEEALSESSLAAAVKDALAKPVPPPHGLDLEGARRTADLLRERLDFPPGEAR